MNITNHSGYSWLGNPQTDVIYGQISNGVNGFATQAYPGRRRRRPANDLRAVSCEIATRFADQDSRLRTRLAPGARNDRRRKLRSGLILGGDG